MRRYRTPGHRVKPHYQDTHATVYHGDCLDVMRELPDCSVDAVVTDPPYGLEFMGREWDAPWQRGDRINAPDAGFNAVEMTDGHKRLPRPSFTGSTNPACLNCGGKNRGRRDGTAKVRTCVCESPRFPNVRAVEMRAFQDWCEVWAVECSTRPETGRIYRRLRWDENIPSTRLRDRGRWLRDTRQHRICARGWC